MENQENIAGLGKDHDAEARQHDLAKKQSEAKPAAENLEMEPNSINKDGSKEFSDQDAIHNQAVDYAKEEHDKAENWEHKEEQDGKV